MCTTDTKQLHTSFVACVNLWHAVHLAKEFLGGQALTFEPRVIKFGCMLILVYVYIIIYDMKITS